MRFPWLLFLTLNFDCSCKAVLVVNGEVVYKAPMMCRHDLNARCILGVYT